MAKRPAVPPAYSDVVIERPGGERYVGRYTVQRETITVHYGEKSTTTQLGNTPPHALARLLLAELIEPKR